MPSHPLADGTPSLDRAAVRRFHLGAPGAPAGSLPQSLLPAALRDFRNAGAVRTDYPVFLAPPGASDGAVLAFEELLARAARALDGGGAPLGQVLRDNAKRLERAVIRRLEAGGPEVTLTEPRELLLEAGEVAARELRLDGDARAAFHGDVERLAGAVPEGGSFIAAGPEAPLRLLLHALRVARARATDAFAAEARLLAARARDLLDADRLEDPEARTPERLNGSMGPLGSRLLDPSALAGVLGERRGTVSLGEERRRALEEAAALLEEAAAGGGPCPVVVHDDSQPWVSEPAWSGNGESGPWSWTALRSTDPCAAAVELFDKEAAKTARLLAAVRRVRLEVAGELDPELHEPLLRAAGAAGGFDWQSFSRDELGLVPPIVALESAGELAGRGMVTLSRLLRSGRPVEVLVVDEPAGDPGAGPDEEPTGYRFQPAALGLAHREAFVQQGSWVRPVALGREMSRAAAVAAPGLHVVDAFPGQAQRGEGLPAAVVAGAAVEGRAHPLLRYDPEAGTSWADRLAFDENPAPDEDWPVREGAPFTFADFCLLVAERSACFLPLPDDAPEEGLVPMAEWLALSFDEALEAVPVVLGIPREPGLEDGGEERTVRLAVSRRLALACRDRLGYWRILQELAGVRSEYVRRAEERVRARAEERLDAERARLRAEHAAELERVRRAAAEEVVERLTAALLGLDGGGAGGLGTLLAGAAGPAGSADPTRWGATGSSSGGAAGWPGLSGTDPDRLAGELLELVGPAELEPDLAPELGSEPASDRAPEAPRAEPGGLGQPGEDGPAARLAGELLSLLDPAGLDLQEPTPDGDTNATDATEVDSAAETDGTGAPSRRTEKEPSP